MPGLPLPSVPARPVSGPSESPASAKGGDAPPSRAARAAVEPDDALRDAPQSPQSPQGPTRLSAQGLHRLALDAFRIGNRGRLSLCSALRALAETRLFIDLGYPSIAAYADRFLQLRRAEAFEYVRVAHALTELTELRNAFGCGELGWSALKAITRVASQGSQASWIEFARKHGTERTLAEARDALRSRRDAPRKSSFGLPNLDQKLVLRFSRRPWRRTNSGQGPSRQSGRAARSDALVVPKLGWAAEPASGRLRGA